MRKFRCVVCAMVLCAALGGCGDKKSSDDTATKSDAVTENTVEDTEEEIITEEKKTTEEKAEKEDKTTEEKTEKEEKTTEEKTTEEKKTTEATTQAQTEAATEAQTEATTEAPTEATTEAQNLKAIAQGYIGSDAYALIGAIGGNLVVVNACTDESAGYALIYYDGFTVQCEQATPDSPWIVIAVF